MLLRLVAEFRRGMDLSVALDAEGVPHELRSVGEEQWALVIADEDAARAGATLAAVEREISIVCRSADVPETAAGVAAGLVFFLAIVFFQVWTGAESSRSEWFARGSAEAERILRGEWWRALTALTLHADAGHAAGNAVLGGLLLALLGITLGVAVANVVVLGSGFLCT